MLNIEKVPLFALKEEKLTSRVHQLNKHSGAHIPVLVLIREIVHRKALKKKIKLYLVFSYKFNLNNTDKIFLMLITDKVRFSRN